ncbi:MAG: hypothetical protein ACE10B_06310 [Phycisphaerales bacterium]
MTMLKRSCLVGVSMFMLIACAAGGERLSLLAVGSAEEAVGGAHPDHLWGPWLDIGPLWPWGPVTITADPPWQADRWWRGVAPNGASRMTSAPAIAPDLAHPRAAETLCRLLDDIDQRLDDLITSLETIEHGPVTSRSEVAVPPWTPTLDARLGLDLFPPPPLQPEPLASFGELDLLTSPMLIDIDAALFDKPPAMMTTNFARPAIPTTTTTSLIEVFMRSTAIAFLAAVLLVPVACSFAAGTFYGWPRDGPQPAASTGHVLDDLSRVLANVPSY